MVWQFILLAIVCGIASSVQVGLNASMAKGIESPIWGAIIALAIGAIGLAVYAVCTNNLKAKWQAASTMPLWVWTGGLLGAVFVAGAAIAAPKVGATAFVGLLLLGQVLASLILDHYGWLGFEQVPISLGKLIGIGCLCVGVFLIKKG